MNFKPIIKDPPRLMDGRIFQTEPMGLKEDLLTLTLEERLTYDAEENLFFVNFEGYAVKSLQQVEDIKNAVKGSLRRWIKRSTLLSTMIILPSCLIL